MTIPTLDLIKSLRSTTCPACGGAKKAAQSFCFSCYRRLPPALMAAVYDRVGEGYEAAVGDSMNVLRATKFRMPPESQPAVPAKPSSIRPDDAVMTFGRYQGKTLGDILAADASYLDWVQDKITAAELRHAVKAMCHKYAAEIERAIDDREFRRRG